MPTNHTLHNSVLRVCRCASKHLECLRLSIVPVAFGIGLRSREAREMNPLKETSLRGVVLSLLFAVTLLISLSIALNRVSSGVSSYHGFANLATLPVFDHQNTKTRGQEPAPPSNSTESAWRSDGDVRYSGTVKSADSSEASSAASLLMSASDTKPEELPLDTAISPVSSEDLSSADASPPPLGAEPTTAQDGDADSTQLLDSSGRSPPPSSEVYAVKIDVQVDSDLSVSSEESSSAPPSPVRDEQVPDPVLSDEGAHAAAGIDSSPSTDDNLEAPVDRSVASKQRKFQPASLPHYSFVKFSAYRLSLHTFFVTGISSAVARIFDHDKIAHTCEWHPADGTLPKTVHKDATQFKETEATMIYVKHDENHGTYSPVIINCTFADEVGADGKGGLLALRISTGYDRWEPNLPVVAMDEQPGDVDIVMNQPKKFPYQYAFCGAPLHGKMRMDWLLQWMTYHHYLWDGKAHFFFYNLGGLADEDRPLFKAYLDAGLMSVTDILDPNLSVHYPTWYFHQVLLVNDCLHRSRFMAEHVFFFDYDEFLQIPAPNTLPRLLRRYKDAPWISFGNMYVNTHDCRWPRTSKAEAPLERMLWRQPEPECRQRDANPDPWLCVGPWGRRKYVVNPRKTFAAGVHFVTIPEEGVNLRATEARMLHYRSAPKPQSKLCATRVKLGKGGENALLAAGWIRDEAVAQIYSKAKNFPIKAYNAIAEGGS